MKKFFATILILILSFSLGCSAEKNSVAKSEQTEVADMKIKIHVGEKIFTATLENNPSAQEFIKKLPLEITMTELNGNEKYYKFSENFPSADENVGEIHSGDLMLYSSSYVVLFYKNFSTPYSYTRLGKIDNVENLPEILGNGNIPVKFTK